MYGEVLKINRDYKDALITVRIPAQKNFKIEEGDIISISPQKADKRTLRQNAFMWARLAQLSEYTAGDRNSDVDLYIELLERTGAKTEYIMATEQAGEAMKKIFRAVKMVGEAGDGLYTFKCYYGSSTFTPEEMARLLDELTELEYEIYAEETHGRKNNTDATDTEEHQRHSDEATIQHA